MVKKGVKMTKLEKAKEVIKNNYENGNCGIYNSHGIYEDEMITIYNEDGLTIDICYEWKYFEVFGLLQDDFEQLKEYYYKVLGEKFASVENIDAVPTTKGKWTDAIITADNLYDRLGMLSSMHGYVCSCCQNFSVARYKYCPNCGADMREGGT